LLWEQTGLPLAVRRARLDVLFNPGFTCPALCSCPAVTVFHDLQHKRHPEHFRWFDLPFWRVFLYVAAHRSRLLIAVSEATRKDLEQYYRLPRESICVVPEGVDERFFEIGRDRAASEAEPILLAVSTLHPHKNLDRLIRVFARFHADRPDFRLVIVGLRGFHAEEIEKEVKELGLGGVITLTGWIPREQLYSQFRRAHSFVYPSTFEGFGLPVLEALAAGIPSACSTIEPLTSLAGDAALQFHPQDEDAMLDSIRRLTCDLALRDRLAQQGPRRAAAFSWRKTAEATLAALRDTVSNPRT
jgi:glycosyltransferase involved in cell wall biosynthesis